MTTPEKQPAYMFVMSWEPSDLAGGVNEVVANLWTRMEREGKFRPIMLVASWEHPRAAETVTLGRRTVLLRLRTPWGAGGARIRNALVLLASLPVTLGRLARILRRENVVAVNFHFPATTAIWFVLLRILGLYRGEVALTFHNTDIWMALQTRGVERAIWRFILARVDCCMAVSDHLRRQVLELCPSAKAVAIHNGLDFDRFIAERDPSFRLDPRLMHAPFILCVASFNVQKGQDTLVEAFATVGREFPDLLLVLIGKTAPFLAEVHGAVARFGLADRVLFFTDLPHGHLLDFFGRAKLFVLPARREGFGLVLLEAGMFDVPIVATDVGGIPEVVTQGETAVLVPPDDPARLADAMLDVLRHPEAARAMAERHRRAVEGKFSWETAYRAYTAPAASRLGG